MDKKDSDDPLADAKKASENRRKEDKVIPLALIHGWADDRRAAPSAAFRSALFPALGRQKRKNFNTDEVIYSVNGVTVLFRGEQFDQSDLDVYLEILHLMRDQQSTVEFTANGLLKSLGKSTGNKDHKWLHNVIMRLVAGLVNMTDHKTEYFGHLIDGGSQDKITKKYSLCVHAKMARLFKAAWSSIDIEERRRLKSDTAKALHAYYSSHINPALHTYETLANIAGIKGVNRKTTVLKAHKELEAIGFLLSWEPSKEGIKIKPTLTKTQARSVTRKIIKHGIASVKVIKNVHKSA